MKRRKFLELSALGSASAILLNGRKVSAFSQTALLNQLPDEMIDGRSVVLIQMGGGNDGLNTLIPLEQYDLYANLRKNTKIKVKGKDAAINLDKTLPLEYQMYLHPSLQGFKDLYDAGKLNIINGVGYPIATRSHFTSRAQMFKGEDGTKKHSDKYSGWMARYLNAAYNYKDYEDPLGIQLGAIKPSLGFHSEHEHKVDVNLTGQNVSGYNNVISNIGNPEPMNLSKSEHADKIKFIGQIQTATNSYSQRISEVFNNGKNIATYPDYDLADQLKTVAKMVKGGSKTKIFLVNQGGYDTHTKQVVEGETHKGEHAYLLRVLGDSVKAFQDDLEKLGIQDKVVCTTFTEFGRKPLENGNFGTDHGSLAPMFVIGNAVNGGVSGKNLNLDGIKKHFPEKQRLFDYRQVFTSLLTDFLGANKEVLTQTEFIDFDNAGRPDLINDDYFKPSKQNLIVYPNPVHDFLGFKLIAKQLFRGYITLYDMSGKLVFSSPHDFKNGINTINAIQVGNLAPGNYILAIKDSLNFTIEKQHIIKS